jgi:fucose permease
MKKGLALSLVVMAAGAAMFGQFATQRWYPGVDRPVRDRQQPGLLQTAVNPYISILGPIETRRGASR